MALFHIQDNQLHAVQQTTYAKQLIQERNGLQAMLIKNIAPLGEDLFVVCEEYGNFEDSYRRIDLLCLDKDRKLVIVEIKRTEDGGHAELQAVRYAAMVSSMNIDEVVAAHAEMLKKSSPAENSSIEVSVAARNKVFAFLGLSSDEDVALSEDIRIILVSSQFSSEITTTVLWLNRQGLDISCVRLIPYQHANGETLIDATRIIPLPETEQYEIKIRSREIETRNKAREKDAGFSSLWRLFLDKSNALNKLFDNRQPNTSDYIAAKAIKNRFFYRCFAKATFTRADIYISMSDKPETVKQSYEALEANKASIEQAMGHKLEWLPSDGFNYARITLDRSNSDFGDITEEQKAEWMAQTLNRLYEATRAYL